MGEFTSLDRAIELRQLLGTTELFGASDARVSGCTANYRLCRPGDAFIALPADPLAWHTQIAEAISRGAAAIVAEQPVRACPIPVCYVTDISRAYGLICQALAGHPTKELRVVAAAGSHGKTTVAALLASVLETCGHPCGQLSTLGQWDGIDWSPAPSKIPPPIWADALRRMQANGCTHAAIEAPWEDAASTLSGVELDVLCLTNSKRGSERASAESQRLLALASLLRSSGVAVVNADDIGCVALLDRIDNPTLTVGIHAAAEIMATPVEQHASEQLFLVHAGSETIPVRTSLIGRHNIYHCLAATAVGLAYGFELSQIVRGLELVAEVPGRLERLECGQPFSVFVDCPRTLQALTTGLETLRSITRGRLLCVVDPNCFGPHDRLELSGILSSHADVAVYSTGQSATSGIAGFHSVPKNDSRGVVRWALEQASVGDSVLLATLSDQGFAEDDDEDDCRHVARQWLYGAGGNQFRLSA